jgi:DNA-3-methyladenine glycosylase II
VPGAWDGFELAVRAILGQQITVATATRLAGKLVAAYGTPLGPELLSPGLSHARAARAAGPRRPRDARHTRRARRLFDKIALADIPDTLEPLFADFARRRNTGGVR